MASHITDIKARDEAHSDLARALLIPHPLLLLPVPQTCRASFHSRTSVLAILYPECSSQVCIHSLTHPLQVSLKCHVDTKVFSDHPSHSPSLYPSSFSFMVFMTSYFIYTFFLLSVSPPLQSKFHERKDSMYNGSMAQFVFPFYR